MASDSESAQSDSGVAAAPRSETAYVAPDFDALYAEHFRFVWRTLRRLGVPEAALDDASQDVFIAVHRRLPEYEPRCSSKAWIFAIVRRVASDHRRTRKRKGGLEPLGETAAAAPADGPQESASRNQAARIVLDFLDSLQAEQREAFILSELEQMTGAEIAEALSLNQNTIYSRVRAARRALHEFVVTHYPDLPGELNG